MDKATQLVIVSALKSGLMCCELLIKDGGATAIELSEVELPLIKYALKVLSVEVTRSGGMVLEKE